MRKKRLFMGGILIASLAMLASCDITGAKEETKTKTERITTTPKILETTTEEPKMEMKYDVMEPIISFWEDSIHSRWVKIIVPVKNTGTMDLYLGNCQVDLETKSHKLLDSIDYIGGYPEYIMPGEVGYYYKETIIDFPDENVLGVVHENIEKASNKVIRYNTSDVTIEEDEIFGIEIKGRVENDTSKDESIVVITANLYDSNDKLICNCFTYLSSELKASSKMGFSIVPIAYRSLKLSDIARYEIYAYPKQYNIDLGF